MQIHQLQPIHERRKEKRVGRGGAHGFTSGRGAKGQSSRAGHRVQPIIRKLIKKYPKLKGYRFHSYKIKPAIVNLKIIEKYFSPKDKITPSSLLAKGLISREKGRVPNKVKILGEGELTKPLVFVDCLFSKSAKEKTEKAGGVIK